MNRVKWMKGICHMWSRGRHFSPSMPGDRYLNLSSQKRSPGRNLGEHRLVRRSGTTSRGTALLVFCLRMRLSQSILWLVDMITRIVWNGNITCRFFAIYSSCIFGLRITNHWTSVTLLIVNEITRIRCTAGMSQYHADWLAYIARVLNFDDAPPSQVYATRRYGRQPVSLVRATVIALITS